MNTNAGCGCCAARTCLLAWTGIIVGLNGIDLIYNLVLGIDFADHAATAAILPVRELFLVAAAAFTMIAAYQMKRRLLRIAFWIQIAIIVFAVILLLFQILLIAGVIGHYTYDDVGIRIGETVFFYCIVLVGQSLLAWTIKKTLTEAEEAKMSHQVTYVPCNIEP